MNLKGAEPEKFGAIKSFFYRLWAEPSIEPMHRRIASEVPIEKGSLLDIGCGGGKLDRLIAGARPNVRVVGLDSSEPMLRSARKRFAGSTVEFRLGTIEESGFSGEFDFALSVLSFHHWEEPEKGLAAVRRALVPGGRFWIYEMDPEAPADAIRRDRGTVWGFLRMPARIQRAMARDHGFTAAEAATLVRPVVEKSGFAAFRVHRTGSTLRMELER
jgi:SAM-dependent methyltransferase